MSVLKKHPYDNILMYAENGTMLGFCDEKRAFWYVNRKIGKLSLCGKELRLSFNPKNVDKINVSDTFFVGGRDNCCVVCESERDLTRHHIIPNCFTPYIPEEIKGHNSYDIVCMCETHHTKYEIEAVKYRKFLVEKYGFKYEAIINDIHLKWITTILYHGDSIPVNRKNEMLNIISKEFSLKDTSNETLAKVFKKYKNYNDNYNKNQTELLIKKLLSDDLLHEFYVLWRKHFIEHAKPKNMPRGWDVNAPVKCVGLL